MMIKARFSQILTLVGLSFAAVSFCSEARAQTAFLDEHEEAFELAPDQSGADSAAFTFEGTVHLPDGTPDAGAVVVSSAGGQAVTDEHGKYRLESRVPIGAERIEVTAVGGVGGKLVANQQVLLSAASGAVSIAPLHLTQSSGCTPSWLPSFGATPGTWGRVSDMAVFDDGTGEALYVCGLFYAAGQIVTQNIAKWNGLDWEALSGGFTGGFSTVTALQVFDDGSGSALYVGGNFDFVDGMSAHNIAKWDGSNWSAPVPLNASVSDMTIFDDGTGPALFVGGGFTDRIKKWDGTTWSGIGTALNAGVLSLGVFDAGTGAELYVGGSFTMVGAIPTSKIAKWDGTSWSAFGTGIESNLSGPTSVQDFVVFDDGSGDDLYVGGRFTSIDGVPASNLARWDGSNWSALGSGLSAVVGALKVFNDGNGDRLFVGGAFTSAGGVTANRVAQWDGSNWSPVGTGVSAGVSSSIVSVLGSFDDGSGSKLFAGGSFLMAGSVPTSRIASWDGSSWSSLGNGFDHYIHALAVFDDGSGEALYAGGSFYTASGVLADRVAKWNGSSWSPVGGGFDDDVLAFAIFDDGNGDRLFAAGDFDTAGGVPANKIAKWDGTSWAPVGAGMNGSARAMTVFDGGAGPRLIAGGSFYNGGGLANVGGILQWDGSTWERLGRGTNGSIESLQVFNSGAGERLIAGGRFTSAGLLDANRIAEWDGSSWAPLGNAFVNGMNERVLTMTVFDDGSGAALYAGGQFGMAGGSPIRRIGKWDGTSWSALGTGMNDGCMCSYPAVYDLVVYDDGSGEELYACGEFSDAGGVAANHIAKWNGTTWAPLGSGFSHGARALASFDDGNGTALYAGGTFFSVPDSGDSFLGKWGCESTRLRDLCSGDGGDQLGCTDCPCMNNTAPGTLGGCLNSAATSASLIATGDLSVSLASMDVSDLRFSLTGAPPSAFGILNSGDGVAPGGMANPCFGLNSGVQATQFDGLRCAIVNTRRHGGRAADSNGEVGVTNDSWGGEGGPPVGIAQQGAGFASGQTRYFQVIYRDDALLSCMRGLNTSQAVEVTFTP